MAIWVTISLFVFYVAYKARPAYNKNGEDIHAPNHKQNDSKAVWQSAKEKTHLTIGTYNIQTGKNSNGIRDISKSAELIKHADIVGIQEVYAATWHERILGNYSQTEQLAVHSGFGWLFAATRLRWFREHRGNALLSRIPIHEWSIQMLPDQTKKQYRNLVIAKTFLNDTEITLLITHLHTKKGQKSQLEFVLNEFEKYDRAILMGDFNKQVSKQELQPYIDKNTYHDAIKQALPNISDDRIDWILIKGLTASKGFYEPIGISDHPYYQVDVCLDE